MRRTLMMIVAVGVTASCTTGGTKHAARPTPPTTRPGSACTVTRPTDRAQEPSARLRQLTPGEDTWYGRDDLWALLPPQESIRHRGRYQMKIGWWRGGDHPLRLRATAVTSRATAVGDTGSAGSYAAPGMLPTTIDFPKPGCWKVTGTLRRTTVTFTVAVF